MTEDLISIIIAVYNNVSYIEKCVNSITSQQYRNLEILIIDDGSIDGCGAVCDQLAQKDSRITVFHQKNAGQSAARNLGLEHAKGKYIGFVDSDDYMEPSMIRDLYDGIKQNDAQIACCGRFVVEGENVRTLFTFDRTMVWSSKETIARLLQWDGVDSASWDKLYCREMFENERYPLGIMFDDLVIIPDVLMKAERIVHIGKAEYYNLQHEGSVTRTAGNKKHLSILTQVDELKKHVLGKYPDLKMQMTGFYYKNVRILLRTMHNSEDKELLAGYPMIRARIREDYRDIMACGYLTWKEKVKLSMMMIGIDLY